MKVEIKNPIGKFRREKLEEISLEAKQINEKFNKVDAFIDDFEKIKGQINVLFEFMVEENTEPTAEEIKEMEEQAKAVQEQMETTIQNALINLVNKPENQKSIMDFAEQFSQGLQGKGSLANLVDADGNPNWVAMIEKLMSNRGMGGQPQLQGQPAAQTKGKSTGY